MGKLVLRIVGHLSALLLCLAAVPSPSAASCWPPTETARCLSRQLPFVESLDGLLRTRNYLDLDKNSEKENLYEFRNDLRFGGSMRFSENLTMRISAEQDLHYALDRQDDYRPEHTNSRLREGYIDWRSNSLDLRIGQQILRWGKGDELNPVDNFTPENFREFINLDRSDRKMGIPAAYLKYFSGERVQLEGIWLPVFKPSRFAGSDQRWEFFFRRLYRSLFDLDEIPEELPARNLENSSYAARTTYRGDYADISLSYAYHFEQNELYRVDLDPKSLSSDGGPVTAVWDRLHTIGADFETVYDKFGIRGELAYVFDRAVVTEDTSVPGLLIRRDALNTLIGTDYTLEDGTYLNFQVLQDWIFDREPGMFWKAYELSVTGRIRRGFYREILTLEVTGRSYITQDDWFVRPGAIYTPIDNLELLAYVHIFRGDPSRIFGQFRDNDQLYLGAAYYF